MAKTYYEKLKDPKWQKMRLKILERDNFSCCRCGNQDETLNIHHIQYKKVTNPWDYPNNYLLTLCEKCHEEEEFYIDLYKEVIVDLYNKGFDSQDLLLLMHATLWLVKFCKDKDRDYSSYLLALVTNKIKPDERVLEKGLI